MPTHSIKKLKSIFNEKNEPIPGAASPPATPATSPNVQDIPSKVTFPKCFKLKYNITRSRNNFFLSIRSSVLLLPQLKTRRRI